MNYPVYKPYLHGNEKKYVNECLDSTWISSKGKFIKRFEDAFADFIKIKYTVSVCNGTVAIHTALMALNIMPGDEVIVPTLTYIASVNPIVYCGATPIFVDSLIDTWQMDPNDVERKITNRTRAIIVVHLYGHSCDMEKIMQISRKHNLFVIEDCAESFGSYYQYYQEDYRIPNNHHTGTIGDIGCFSFFGNKSITTGEGGMVVTNNKELFERILHLKNQGVSHEYFHNIIGYNYRMTNICAAIGLAQLEMADEILYKKRLIAHWYEKYLTVPMIKGNGIYWMICISVDNKDKLRDYLTSKGIETRPVFYPIHMMPMYSQSHIYFRVAETISSIGINLPSYPELTEKDIKKICKTIDNYYK